MISSLVTLLIIFNLLITTYCVCKYSIIDGRIEVNHITLFSMGFVLYWIVPIAVGVADYWRDTAEMAQWYEIYDDVPASRVALYLLISAITYVAFVSGSSFYRQPIPKRLQQSSLFAFHGQLLNLFLLPSLAIATAFSIALRDELFVGYRGKIYEDFGWRGSFTASSLVLLSLALIHIVKLEQRYGFRHHVILYVFNRFSISAAIFAVLVLSLGGRLYFLSSLLMITVYITVFHRGLRVRTVLAVTIALALSTGLVGILRSGGSVTIERLSINLGSEVMYVSLSLIHFLRDGSIEVIQVPRFLSVGFINLIPSFIFPGKGTLLLNPSDYGHVVFMPFGGLHSFFSFMINFGVIGTWLSCFAFGFFLSVLRRNAHLLLVKVMYVMTCGMVAFSFFRDPFTVSIVKNIFEFSILLPAVFVISMHMLTSVAMKKRRQ